MTGIPAGKFGFHRVVLCVTRGCGRPSADKVRKWTHCIKQALQSSVLRAGEASKLAGRLQWACQSMFKRLGRALLRDVYDQQRNKTGRIGPRLKRTLLWWVDVLSLGLTQDHGWNASAKPPVHLFCDAAGNPARLAAVLCVDGMLWYTDCPPPNGIVEHFVKRSDQQIMGLELLSIALGLCTFETECEGRHVIIHSDNKGQLACALVP